LKIKILRAPILPKVTSLPPRRARRKLLWKIKNLRAVIFPKVLRVRRARRGGSLV